MDILISGSGIAGLAAANFLARGGHTVTLIDRVASFRGGGYLLTLKAFGVKILQALGLGEELQRHSLPLQQISFYQADGELLRTYSHELQQEATLGSVTIMRPEIHGVLHRALERPPVRFGLHVEQATEDGQVTLSNGEQRRFDLVIVAEGMRSSTRQLLFPELADHGMKPFGVVYAAGRMEGEHGLDLDNFQTHLGVGKMIALFPVSASRLMVQAAFRDHAPADRPPQFARDKVVEVFREFSPRVFRIVEAVVDHGDLFYDAVARVELPRLHRGRVVFLGDAAHCTTFLSGMGASLGLLSAKVLADSLAGGNIGDAIAAYQRVMTPVIAHFQHTAQTNVATLLSESRWRSLLRDSAVHFLPPSLMRVVWSRQFDVEARLLHGVV